MRTSNEIVKPIARPAIDVNVPRGSAAQAKITQTRKKVKDRLDHEALCTRYALEERRAEVEPVAKVGRIEPPKQQRAGNGAAELRHPVDEREGRRHPARDQECERDGWVEVRARDVADRVREHGNHEAVGERGWQQRRLVGRPGRGHDCAGADEDEREGPDELGGRAAEDVAFHCARKLGVGADG
jgi:hypothetical protein